MSKAMDTKKETKKEPVKSIKEKRLEKKEKKNKYQIFRKVIKVCPKV